MGQMKLEIGDRSFTVTCQDGEEDHLAKLGRIVDEKASEAGDSTGLTESRMLLFASLLLADELHAAKNAPATQAASKPSESQNAEQEQAIAAMEKLADRTEAIANSLE